MNQKKVKIKINYYEMIDGVSTAKSRIIDGFLLTWNISGVTELRDQCGNRIYGEIV